jgi:hypothetical protein
MAQKARLMCDRHAGFRVEVWNEECGFKEWETVSRGTASEAPMEALSIAGTAVSVEVEFVD